MDRASDSGSEGWGFESLPVYQKSRYPYGYLVFCYTGKKGLEKFNSTAQWAVDCRRLDGGNSLMYRVPSGAYGINNPHLGICFFDTPEGWDSNILIQLPSGQLIAASSMAATP